MEAYQIFYTVSVLVIITGFVINTMIKRKIARHKREVPRNMQLKSRHIEAGKFEVNGVVFYADSHPEAIRKYRRGVKEGHYDEA